MKKYSIVCILLASTFFATGGLFFKFASWSSLAICTGRSIISFTIISIFLLIKKHKFVFNKTVLIVALSHTCTGVLYSLANKMTTAGNTIVLQFAMPIYVILITMIYYKKKPTRLEATTCFFVLLGIVLFFVDSLASGNMLGDLFALISGMSYSLVFIFNAKENSDPFSSIQLSLFISALIGMPEFVKVDFVNTAPKALLAVVALGVIQQSLGHIFFSIGIKDTPSVAASLISGIEPILNPLLVAVFYGETLTTLALVGSVLVIVSILRYNVKLSKLKEA